MQKNWLITLGKTLRQSCGAACVFFACTSVAFAGGPVPTPEIDPGSMLTGLTVLVGGLLLITDRVRRK